MTTGKTLEEKPYTGNPHAWFDVGNDASEMSGCGFLFYAKRIFFISLLFVAITVSGAVEIRSGNVNVVVRQGGEPVVQLAASELTNYLSRVLCSAVPVSPQPVNGKVNIFLGENEWSCAESLDPKPLVRDGFISAAKGNRVFLLGVDDARVNPRDTFTGCANLFKFERATLNAVYDFLERYADVRFFFPGELGTVVSRKDSISVPDGVRKVEPVFTERYYGWWCIKKDGWYDKRVTVREMAAWNWLQLRYGSSRKQCCHGLRHFKYVPRFAKTHPDWFCLRADGKRHLQDGTPPHFGNGSKFCYTSPIREAIYQDVKAFLTGKPASSRGLEKWGDNCVSGRTEKYVDIMPEDGFMECRCANCQAAYNKKEKSYATELIWGLTAEIARRLTAEGVEGGVTQMAYSPYNRVPDFNLPPNVDVMVAVTGPWATVTPERHALHMKMLRDWTAKLGHKVWLWTYPGKYPFSGAMPGIPQVSPRAYARFFSEAAPYIIGGYANTQTDRFMFDALNVYTYAKLGWNPSLDIEAPLDDWNGRLFGPAKAEMKTIYSLLEEKWVGGVCKGRVVESALGPLTVRPTDGQLWSEIYTESFLDELKRLFAAAAAKTVPGSLEARRVALMRAELLDSLYAQFAKMEPATELRRREREGTANMIANGDFETMDGWINCAPWSKAALDPDTKVVGGFSLKLASDSMPHHESNVQSGAVVPVPLRFGRTYRLSYFIKTKDVVPYKNLGWPLGAGLCLWFAEGKYEKHPTPLMKGTGEWVHQCHVFTPPVDSPKARLQFRLEHSLGTMWVDGVLLEDVTDNQKGK